MLFLFATMATEVGCVPIQRRAFGRSERDVGSKTVDFSCSTDRFAVEFILLRVSLKAKQTVPS